jgi:hypothetical protein
MCQFSQQVACLSLFLSTRTQHAKNKQKSQKKTRFSHNEGENYREEEKRRHGEPRTIETRRRKKVEEEA